MMRVLSYISDHLGILSVLLAVSVLAVLFLCLYMRERRKCKAAGDEVSEEREFYRLVACNRGDVHMLIRREDLRVMYVSPNLREVAGIEAEAVRADIEVLKEAVSRGTARKVVRLLKGWDGTGTFESELDFRVIGGDRTGRGKLCVVCTEDRSSYLASFYDITGEYAIRQQLQKELDQAHQESRAKTDFLSKMSHEIRTPMNGILGLLSLAKAHADETDTVEEYLEKTESLSQFLLTLINDILDMSRIESGKMELEEVPFDLYGVADKLNEMFDSTAKAKGIAWKVRLQDLKDRYVVGDELRLTQVIINFISNAMKFTPAGGTVSVTFRQMHKIDGNLHLMIRVRDTGKGIKPGFISRIFRPFEQEEASTAHHYGGSGLGMAIADNIIKLMNGQIIVDSEEGRGTEFAVYLSLPIAGEGQEPLESPEIARRRESQSGERKKEIEKFTLNGLRILLAEDNDLNAEIAIELLEMEGASVERACDGTEAVEMFRVSEPGYYDAILMDIQMPSLDGWDATAEIRKLPRQDVGLPILAMSANAFVEDKRHSIEVGMDGHISKPVDFDEVRRVLAECLYRH